MKWNELEPRVNSLKQAILSIMNNVESMTQKGNEYLPKLNDSFFNVREAVQNPSYDVVVCGEVKKGKSSLLNAIIGKQILPVAHEIATSQVFRIAHSDKESYSLVFTDGTSETITLEQLNRYGSQVDAVLNGEPIFKNRTLDYIQVNMPIAFLPKGVNLVDTPGLGALYKRHEYITNNYVKRASAVLFVMDPEAPLVDQEKAFISKVLDITPNILFVMTKIDIYNETVYKNIIERNEEILALIYAEKNKVAPHIYPVSSKVLDKVKDIPDELERIRKANLRASKFLEVRQQLLLTIYRTVGLYHSYLALNESKNAVQKAIKVITDLKNAATIRNQEEEARLTQELNSQISDLSTKWGDDSLQRNKVQQKITMICNSLKGKTVQMLSHDGNLYKEYARKIDEINGIKAAQDFVKNMADEISNDVSREWENLMDNARQHVINELSEFDSQMECSTYGNGYIHGQNRELDFTWKDYLPPIRNVFFISSILTTILTLLFGPVGTFIASILGALGAWLLFKDQIKSRLRGALNDAMNEISGKMLQIQEGKEMSLVDEFAYELNQSAQETIRQIYTNRAQEAQQQKNQLIAQAKRTIAERQEDIEKWNQRITDWNPLVTDISKAIDARTEIAAKLGITYKK